MKTKSFAMGIQQAVQFGKALAGILHGSRAFGAPLSANIALTSRCNVRCVHCYYYSPYRRDWSAFDLRRSVLEKEGGEHTPLDADPARLMAQLRELIDMGTPNFLFSGEGEPFLHPQCLDFMAAVKAANRKCSVNTNGTHLTPEVMDSLLRMGVDELRITTMAGTPETYVKTHPGSAGVFEAMEANLAYLARRKAAAGARTPAVNLVFIAVAQNVGGVSDFVDFAVRVKADRVTFRPVSTIEDSGLLEIVPNRVESDLLLAQMGAARRHLEGAGIAHNLPHFIQSFNQQLDTTALYERIPCYYGWIQARIAVDGNVHPCCRCTESMGNTSHQSFREIWQGEGYRRFRKSALGINRRRTKVSGCFCHACPNYIANIRVYNALHPLSRVTMHWAKQPDI